MGLQDYDPFYSASYMPAPHQPNAFNDPFYNVAPPAPPGVLPFSPAYQPIQQSVDYYRQLAQANIPINAGGSGLPVTDRYPLILNGTPGGNASGSPNPIGTPLDSNPVLSPQTPAGTAAPAGSATPVDWWSLIKWAAVILFVLYLIKEFM